VLCACELAVNSTNYLSAEVVSKGTFVAGEDILQFCKNSGDFFFSTLKVYVWLLKVMFGLLPV
jgi:hypothetical protein